MKRMKQRIWIAVLTLSFSLSPSLPAEEIDPQIYTYLDAADDSLTRGAGGAAVAVGAGVFGGLFRFEGREYLEFNREANSGLVTRMSLQELDLRIRRAWSGNLPPEIEITGTLVPQSGQSIGQPLYVERLRSSAPGTFASEILKLEQQGYRIVSVTIRRNGAGQAVVSLLVHKLVPAISLYSALHFFNTWRHLQTARANRNAAICNFYHSQQQQQLLENQCTPNLMGIFTGQMYKPQRETVRQSRGPESPVPASLAQPSR